MTKMHFLLSLRDALAGLPQAELEERLSFYCEMIEDRIEEGLSEEEAVADVGTVEEIAAQIVTETPLARLVREKITPKRRLKTWEIVLLAVGSPVWVSLLVAAVAVVLSLYAALWAVVVSVWAAFGSLIAGAVGGVGGGVLFAILGYTLSGLGTIGAALVCGGLAIFAFFGCRAATEGILRLTKKLALGMKLCFMKGRATE